MTSRDTSGGPHRPDGPMAATPAPTGVAVLSAVEKSGNILSLASALLRICRDEIEQLVRCDSDVSSWLQRDRLRRRCETFFDEVDDEDIDEDERQQLAAIAAAALKQLPPVGVARAIAEALDTSLGSRLLPMFLNRSVLLREHAPIPTPHPDWRNLTPSPSSDPWVLDGRLDALPHLRLASDWARRVRVTLDGDWRTWHAMPQLAPGDRLACALPNEAFDEFTFERSTVEGRAVFSDMRPAIPEADQIARCIGLLEAGRDEGCRVVVFPELSVPKPALEAMARWLDSQDQIELVVAGSRHRRARGGAWHNEAQLLFRGWRQRRRHRKFRPFSFIDTDGPTRLRRWEHLAVGTPTLRVWLSPSWTVVTLICKDAVQEPVPRLLGDLRANLVMVPCMSFKMDAFETAAADIATWSQGVTLMANTGFGPSRRSKRRPVVIGLPSQHSSVFAVTPAGRSLVVVTIGNKKKKPIVRTLPFE